MKKIIFVLFLVVSSLCIAGENKYEIEEGEITYQVTSPQGNGTTIVKFIDWGRTSISVSTFDIQSNEQKSKLRIIETPEWIYTLNDVDKSYIKESLEEYEDSAEEMEMQDLGAPISTETIAGKQCDVYQQVYDGVTMKLWMWKGIPLKTSMNHPYMKSETVATSFKNKKIPKSEFQIPKGYTEQENPADQMMENFDKMFEMMQQENE